MAKQMEAKILDARGEKYQERQEFVGKTIRTHNFETALANMLSNKDFAKYKVMMFLSGNMAWRDKKQSGKPFRVVKKTVCERCNITERSYKDIMQDLEARGWIERTDDFCIVRYDNFFAEWDEYLAKEMSSDFKSNQEMSSSSVETDGITEMSSEILGNEFRKKQEMSSEILGNEFTHNNIRNNIKEQNNENNITEVTFVIEGKKQEETEKESADEGYKPSLEEIQTINSRNHLPLDTQVKEKEEKVVDSKPLHPIAAGAGEPFVGRADRKDGDSAIPVFYLLFPGVSLQDLISMGKARKVEDGVYEITDIKGNKTLVKER